MTLLKNEHPDRASLFEHAEQLEAGRVEFGSPIAAHVRLCKRCAAELDTMRRSISLASFASKTIEPTIALEASTILAMKSQRQAHRMQLRRRIATTASLAAVFMVTMSVTFSSSNTPHESGIAKVYPRNGQKPVPVTYESLTTVSPEERLLGPAIQQSNWQPASRWERSQSEALKSLDEDIDEALRAIESNPALVRAGAVIHANRETKRQTLKSLYAQRDL